MVQRKRPDGTSGKTSPSCAGGIWDSNRDATRIFYGGGLENGKFILDYAIC